MKQSTKKGYLAVLVLIACLLIHWTVSAQSGNDMLTTVGSTYGISWWTVDGGGGTIASNNGKYSLSGTFGQPDAGELSSSEYGLVGGFWGSGSLADQLVYLPILEK